MEARIPLADPFQRSFQKHFKEVFGLKFKNRVGLAAGFDKDAVLYNELSNFGFGSLSFLVLLHSTVTVLLIH